MATLEEALLGLNVRGADTGYGIAAQQVGQLGPQLINPYGSTGQALGIGLGTILLQSLLGYQARSQAAQDTLQTNTLANQMMSMGTPQARTDFIGGLSDPFQQSRLSTLATALTAQEQARKVKAATILDELRTKGEFEMGPLGTSLYKRELEKQAAIQDAVTQRVLDAERLKAGKPNIPAAMWSQVTEQNATADMAVDIADQIKGYTSIPQFVKAKTLSAFADDQLKQRLQNVGSLVILSRTGKSSNETERKTLDSMIKGDLTAVNPKVVEGLLRRFAADERTFAANVILSASQSPETFVTELQKAAQEGRKSQFTFAPDVTPQLQSEKPTQQTGSDYLAGLKAKYGTDWKDKLTNTERATLKAFVDAAKGQ